jgi:tetratricopeptide (TPR) repeat protein
LKVLANLYDKMGRYAEAEQLLVECIDGNGRVFGSDHPRPLDVTRALAGTYVKQGRFAEAEPLYVEAGEGLERALGDDHPFTLAAMHGLASLYLTRKPASSRDPAAALGLALEVAEKTQYENSECLDTLALAYHLTGDTAKAIENQRKAIALLPEGESERRTGFEESLAKFEAALRVERG